MVTAIEKKIIRKRIHVVLSQLTTKEYQLGVLKKELLQFVKAIESRMTDSDSEFESLHSAIGANCAAIEERIKAI